MRLKNAPWISLEIVEHIYLITIALTDKSNTLSSTFLTHWGLNKVAWGIFQAMLFSADAIIVLS